MNDVVAQALEFIHAGGFVMPPLVLGTLVLWYALGYRLMVLRRGEVSSLRKLVSKLLAGGQVEPMGILDEAAVRGVQIVGSGMTEPRAHLDEAFYPLEQALYRNATLIRTIVIVAPLAGLLGTVTGMIETFDSLGDMSLFSQSGGIAGGISQALITTQMGLAVAIPGLLMGKVLDNRADAIADELERLKDLLCGESGDLFAHAPGPTAAGERATTDEEKP
jgi:biopolymer transport protein ExbB